MPQQYADDAYFLSLYPQFLILQRARWRVTVLSAVPDTQYSITASADPPYAATAVDGETLSTLRGKLKTTVNGNSLLVTAASNLAAELVLTEVVAGSELALSVEPEDGLSLAVIASSDKYAALRATWLEETKPFIGLCTWGAKASLGHAALAAHYIAEAISTDPTSGLSASAIKAMREGPASVEFGGGQQTASNDPLASTGFGRSYLAMRRTLVLTPIADIGAFACC